jgi:glutathione peroxidase
MAPNISNISVNTITGEAKLLSEYQGKVLLIINVASYCGYTKQYAAMEELYQQYQGQGFELLAFPCNDYGAQEPDSNEKIAAFCEVNYSTTFPLFDKVHAKGAGQHPLYAELTQAGDNPGEAVAWNFEKFLISKTGEVIGRYQSGVTPMDPSLIRDLEQALAA